MAGWLDGWMGEWVGRRENRSMECQVGRWESVDEWVHR